MIKKIFITSAILGIGSAYLTAKVIDKNFTFISAMLGFVAAYNIVKKVQPEELNG